MLTSKGFFGNLVALRQSFIKIQEALRNYKQEIRPAGTNVVVKIESQKTVTLSIIINQRKATLPVVIY